MGKEILKISIISVCILCLLTLSAAFAQQKVGGGDIKYEATGSLAPVLFSHESHVKQHKVKCNDCHPKIFKTKKSDLKMTQADFTQGKYCGSCHDGKKAFSAVAEADCVKCHKK